MIFPEKSYIFARWCYFYLKRPADSRLLDLYPRVRLHVEFNFFLDSFRFFSLDQEFLFSELEEETSLGDDSLLDSKPSNNI